MKGLSHCVALSFKSKTLSETLVLKLFSLLNKKKNRPRFGGKTGFEFTDSKLQIEA